MSAQGWTLVGAVVILLGGVGCNKPPANDPGMMKAAATQPGAAEVMAAIAKKDFEGVLPALSKAREQATNEEQNVQFMILAHQAREKLVEIAPNDPKALEVVAALRALISGGR